MPAPPVADPEILYEDTQLLVVLKPAGLPTTAPAERGGDDGHERCLADVVHRLRPGEPGLHASSRLDADVSGVVVFARTRAANARLLEARRSGRYVRRYLALGPPSELAREGQWRWPIALDPRNRRRRIAVTAESRSASGKPSCTDYRIHATVERGCLLALAPHTGRTHQLRVHAATAGVPLYGDVHYGGARRLTLSDGRSQMARRVMLHCARVALPDATGGELVFNAALPLDLRTFWGGLGGNDEQLDSAVVVPFGRG